MSIILKAENISKQYRLGNIGTGTIKDDLKRNWYALSGKENPFLKVGAVNDRAATATEDYVWALRDINFEVVQGEVLGIIGKNGAGKSTLLKILSRVTAPTTGVIKTKGRIASLLEVGTGFHPELTGRENIYLNGAILGMSKTEITSKLDEIINFSGCERYIDTPTKRYSSGMTVRLAFAVAAHLEPEILVVDEVLAVGDAEFQKKAIGKMQDISKGEGRTVIFVSHDMAAVRNLCTRAILLEDGQVVFNGSTSNTISRYLKNENKSIDFTKSKCLENAKLVKTPVIAGSNLSFQISFKESFSENIQHLILDIYNINEERVSTISTFQDPNYKPEILNDKTLSIDIYDQNLKRGDYFINIASLGHSKLEFYEVFERGVYFKIQDGDYFNTGIDLLDYEGFVYLKSKWSFT